MAERLAQCEQCGKTFAVRGTRGRLRSACYECRPATEPQKPERRGRGRPTRTGEERICGGLGKNATCAYCAKPSAGLLFCSDLCAETKAWERRGPPIKIAPAPCRWCGETYAQIATTRTAFCCEEHDRLSERADQRNRPRTEARKAKDRTQAGRRRTKARSGDATAVDIQRLLAAARSCPKCGERLTNRSAQPNSKHVDHIVPINAGGLHTIGNLRVLCRTCNLGRPVDGSDERQLLIWAAASEPDRAVLPMHDPIAPLKSPRQLDH